MSYSDKVAALAQISNQMLRSADRPTRLKALLDTVARFDLDAEITDDAGGTMIYIPRA